MASESDVVRVVPDAEVFAASLPRITCLHFALQSLSEFLVELLLESFLAAAAWRVLSMASSVGWHAGLHDRPMSRPCKHCIPGCHSGCRRDCL